MTARGYVSRSPERATRTARGWAGRIALGALLLLALGAGAGGVALVAQPDGSIMHFDVALLDGTPFGDYLVPGLILGGVFGLGSLLAIAMGLLGSRAAPFLAFVIGCGQMVWIVVELLIMPKLGFSFLHPTMFGIGLVIALASARWAWPTVEAWRAPR